MKLKIFACLRKGWISFPWVFRELMWVWITVLSAVRAVLEDVWMFLSEHLRNCVTTWSQVSVSCQSPVPSCVWNMGLLPGWDSGRKNSTALTHPAQERALPAWLSCLLSLHSQGLGGSRKVDKCISNHSWQSTVWLILLGKENCAVLPGTPYP